MIINIPRPSVASVRNVFCREHLKYSHSILCPIKFYVQTLRIKLWITKSVQLLYMIEMQINEHIHFL